MASSRAAPSTGAPTAGAQPLGVVLQLAPGSIEGIVHGLVGVLVRGALSMVAVDHDVLAGHVQVQVDVEMLALLMMPVRLLHHHVAAGDAIEELLELVRVVADVRREGIAGSSFHGR